MSTMLHDPLSTALFSKAQSAILGLLFTHPDESFYLRQIVQRTGLGVGHVQRELAALSVAGIIRRTSIGRHAFFQADPACPIHAELRSIMIKTVGAVSILRESVEPLSSRITVAFIFGSVARLEERKASDLDLLIVGDVALRELSESLSSVERKLHREVNPIIYPPREFQAKLSHRHHFLTQVVKAPKLFVVGDALELARLSSEFVDQTPPDVR